MKNLFEVKQDGMTALLVKDKTDDGYTAFYKEDSRAVSEGDTKEEALNNLKKSYNYLKVWDCESDTN